MYSQTDFQLDTGFPSIEPGANVTFSSLMEPLEKLGAPLDAAWGVAKTLYLVDSSLVPAEQYKQVYSRAKKARAVKFQSKPIYEACKVFK